MDAETQAKLLAEAGLEVGQTVFYQKSKGSTTYQTRVMKANKDGSIDVCIAGKIRAIRPELLSRGLCPECNHPLEEHDLMGNCNHPDARRSTGLCGCSEL